MAIDNLTRYNPENVIEYKDKNMYEIRDQIDISQKPGDTVYVAKTGDTLRTIAYDRYDEAKLYWVIAEFNKIIDPFAEIPGGVRLRIPTIDRINEEIF